MQAVYIYQLYDCSYATAFVIKDVFCNSTSVIRKNSFVKTVYNKLVDEGVFIMKYIEVGCSLLPSTKYISIWYSVSGKYLGIQLNRSLQSVTLDLENSSLSMFVNNQRNN